MPDNLCARTTPDTAAWLERDRHVTFHVTPAGSSWLGRVEAWFGLFTRQRIRRDTVTFVSALINEIRA